MNIAKTNPALPIGLDIKKTIQVRYKNWQGETAIRTIIPMGIEWGSTEWHAKEQWLLNVWDVDRNAHRQYALCDIVEFL